MSSNSSNSGRLKGLYLRGKKFWYRYSYQGRQYRVPLETEDEGEALVKAIKIRNNPVLAGAEPLLEEIKTYLKEKREDGTYTRNSVDSRFSVLSMFVADRHLQEVREINETEIRLWLKGLRKRTKHLPMRTKNGTQNAEAADGAVPGNDRRPASRDPKNLKGSTIESYGMVVRGFCTWLEEKKKLRYNPAGFIESRRSTCAKGRPFCRREQVDQLIADAPDKDLKFIQYAGFHAGLRKEEIIQARPEWFDLTLNIITIVESEDWKPKDKDKRTIPLSKAFRKFLVEEMSVDGKLPGPFLLRPEKVQGKARYRYDFRKPFEEYVRTKELDWVKPHVMRHTFASLLAIAGVSIFKIAKWLGDDVRVVERHYAHLLPQDPDVERAFGDTAGLPPKAKEPGIDQAL